MKIKEAARRYNLVEEAFENFLIYKGEKYGIKCNPFLSTIPDSEVEKAVRAFQKAKQDEIEEKNNKEMKAREELLMQQQIKQNAIAAAGGYWEYKVVSLTDGNGGAVDAAALENLLNSLGSSAWHLRCAYSNELGINSNSSGIGGVTTGTNATIDQNILIFERFIKL